MNIFKQLLFKEHIWLWKTKTKTTQKTPPKQQATEYQLCYINYLKTFFTQLCGFAAEKFWKYHSPKKLLTWYTSWCAKKY